LSAIQVIEVARSLGLRVPQDLSVVGFDNIPESVQCTPPLTTVNQPMQRMGAEAITLLLDLMRGVSDRSTHVQLPTELVVRGSTAPPGSPVQVRATTLSGS